MRVYALLMVSLMLLVPTSTLAIPRCSQIDTDFCAPLDCESSWVEWRGSCSTSDREWRCAWQDCDPGGAGPFYSDWQPCNCNEQGEGCDCVLEGTPITMADGSTKPVEAIRVGDRVLSFDEATGTMKPTEVEAVHAPFVTDRYYVIDGMLRVTEGHPILSGGRWQTVAALEVGDLFTDASGRSRAISSIERVDESAMTYTIQVQGGNYVAAGIVVHNKEICQKFMAFPGPN